MDHVGKWRELLRMKFLQSSTDSSGPGFHSQQRSRCGSIGISLEARYLVWRAESVDYVIAHRHEARVLISEAESDKWRRESYDTLEDLVISGLSLKHGSTAQCCSIISMCTALIQAHRTLTYHTLYIQGPLLTGRMWSGMCVNLYTLFMNISVARETQIQVSFFATYQQVYEIYIALFGDNPVKIL